MSVSVVNSADLFLQAIETTSFLDLDEDTVTAGETGHHLIRGGPGNDILKGGPGDDLLIGGRGNDILMGGAGNDILRGGPGNDVLKGGPGNDILRGGSGNNILNGGAGTDLLVGGTGADRFVFGLGRHGDSQTAVGPGRDRIKAFEQGKDRIDLSAFEGATDLVFIGTDPFVAGAGPQLRYDIVNGRTILQIDYTTRAGGPDGRPDAEIGLLGPYALTVQDFIGVVAPQAGRSPAPPDLPAPAPSKGALIFAVNAGGGAVTDTKGVAYEADTAANWVGAAHVHADAPDARPANGDYTGDGIGNADDAVYMTERWGGGAWNDAGPLTFQRGGLAAGDYILTLKMADIYNPNASAGPNGNGIGARVFDVVVNGVLVLDDLDLIATAGLDRAWDVDVPVTIGADGVLTISATASANNAQFSAIALFANPAPGAVTPAPAPVTGPPASAIRIPVGADAQQLVNAAPEGATFWFEAGVHRLVSINPKNGQTFLGDAGAVVSGASLLTAFERDGGAWVIGGQTQEGLRRAMDEMRPGFDHAGHPTVVFMDHVPLTAVDARGKVVGGTYYFDYANDRIYLGDNPQGRLVEAAVSPYAFAGPATDVTIRGLTIEKYASPIQYGAIGHNMPPIAWTIQENEVRLNFGVGILGGSETRILDNHVHNNGQMGLGGFGRNILVEGNELAFNGYWSGINIFWEAGGSKFSASDGLVVRNNHSHHNNGFGLWTDIDNINTLYEGNRLEWNTGGGISHEISFDAVIRNNSFVGNGAAAPQWLWGAAVLVQNSSNVEVYGNVIDTDGGGNGIALIQQDRGGGPLGEYLTTGNHVHHNVISGSHPRYGNSGAIADAFRELLLQGGNRFDHNTYHVQDTKGLHWVWGQFYDWDTYRQVSGQDANSQLFGF